MWVRRKAFSYEVIERAEADLLGIFIMLKKPFRKFVVAPNDACRLVYN